MKKAFVRENYLLLILGLPLIANYFIEGCPSFINNVMIAHLGVTQLAAGAVANAVFITALVFFYGLFSPVGTMVALHYGANQFSQVTKVVRDGFLLAILLSIPFMLSLWYGSDILAYLGQPAKTITFTQQYLHGLVWAVLPDFMTMILWQFFIALGKPKITLISSMLYVPINIMANYVLMFGRFGFPHLGMKGIGLGTAVGFWVLFVGMLSWIFFTPSLRQFFTREKVNLQDIRLWLFVKLGLPMGLTWMIDSSFILVIAFFVGKISTNLLAAQQICFQLTTIALMVMGGFSQALTVRIGHTWGAQQFSQAKIIYYAGLLQTSLLILACSSIFWFKPEWILSLDLGSTNLALIHTATQLLFVFGFYLLANGYRFVLFGILRALKDAIFPACCSLIAFYGFGVLGGYFLLFHWNATLEQFWVMMIFILLIAVVAMHYRFMYHLKRAEPLV